MILISPWSRNTTEGKPSPKNYPYWNDVANTLVYEGYEVVQLSCAGEPPVHHVTNRRDDLSLEQLTELVRVCQTWISVDNFFHHMGWMLGKPGVAIFGMSDPDIFGHPGNVNLLKDRGYLRKRQFGLWSQEKHNRLAFVEAGEVVKSAVNLVRSL